MSTKRNWIVGGIGGGLAALVTILLLVFLLLFGTIGAIIGGLTGLAGGGAAADDVNAACSMDTGGGGDDDGGTESESQITYIRQTIGVAKTMGVSTDGMVIAVMVMLQESAIQNYANDGQNIRGYNNWPAPGKEFWLETARLSLNYDHDAVGHDADSVNPYQQRAAAGWGDTDTSKAATDPNGAMGRLMNPLWSIQAFFGGPGATPNRGLTDISGWQAMPKGVAAQTVQGSAFPDAYNKWEGKATTLVAENMDAPALPLADGAAAGIGTGCDTGILRGIVSRDDISTSTDPRNEALAGFVVEPTWKSLESAGRGQYNFTKISHALDWAAEHGKRVRLRVQPGEDAPDWVKPLDGPVVPFYDHDTGGEQTISRGIWDPDSEYYKAWQDLQVALAAQFDGHPALAEVQICGAGTITCEMFLLQDGDHGNGAALKAAGYSEAGREEAIRQEIVFEQQTWRSAYLTLWGHVYGMLGSSSMSKTYELSDFARTSDPRTVLGHSGADQETLEGRSGIWAYYDRYLSGGAAFTLQTRSLDGGYDGNHPLGDLPTVISLAASKGVAAVELPRGWQRHLTDEQIIEANEQMGAYSSATGDAAAVIAAATRWLGTDYSWGGGTIDGPSEGFAQGAGIIGFDCSSLVQYAVYNGMGRTPTALLGRTTTQQVLAPGQLMLGYNPSAWQPGDLLFWGSSKSNVHHVALYIGNGQLVHAPRTGDVVKIAPVWNGDFYGALRLSILSGGGGA